jgi:hypothetical protein
MRRPTAIIQHCKICKNKFITQPSAIKKGRGKFCSDACRNLGRRARKIRKCQVCKKKFTICLSKIKIGYGKFCSRKCSYLGRRTCQIRRCQFCKKGFTVVLSRKGISKFCSRKCYGLGERTRQTRKCQVCKKKFNTFPSRIKKGGGKFCSKKCRKTSQIRKCQYCKKGFTTYPSVIKKGLGKFCSRKCGGLGRRVGGINSDGYRIITTDNGVMLEHRYVMQKYLGRKLKSTETVHHMKGKADNDISNLTLKEKAHSQGQTYEELADILRSVGCTVKIPRKLLQVSHGH